MGTIIEILLIILGGIGLALIVGYFEDKIRMEKRKISLKESLDLAEIPIVTFIEGDTKLNFLLDTGSSDSHISTSAAKLCKASAVDTDYTFTTGSGSGNAGKVLNTILKYKNESFTVNLYVSEGLDTSFEAVKSNCGVQLHGILGSDFLRKHKYIMDFAELIAYHK